MGSERPIDRAEFESLERLVRRLLNRLAQHDVLLERQFPGWLKASKDDSGR